MASRKTHDAVITVAGIMLLTAWTMFAWESCSGVTVTTRRSGLGANVSAERLASTKRTAVVFTILFGTAGIVALLTRPRE